MSIDRRRLIQCVSAFAGQGLVAAAVAQNWPGRSIVIIVPFPAGGSADLSARLLAEKLKAVFSQPVVVENEPGAGGNLAAAEAARAEPDGYTLFIGTNGTQTINQSLYRAAALRSGGRLCPDLVGAASACRASIGASAIA
jgi:tripartite-type tricarboxylate transporter receptor subunit TctC